MTTNEAVEAVEALIEMESELTVFELLLLMRAATGRELEMGPFEPIWPCLCGDQGMTIEQAPFLPERALRELTLQQRLVRLGLLTIQAGEEDGVKLTPKGTEAVNWFLGSLEDLGFQHDTLTAD